MQNTGQKDIPVENVPIPSEAIGPNSTSIGTIFGRTWTHRAPVGESEWSIPHLEKMEKNPGRMGAD